MVEGAAVARIWHGWTTVDDADAYQSVVENQVFPDIFARDIPGLISADLLRADRVVDGEVEFTTIILFDKLDSVRNFMGDDYRRAHVPEEAQAILQRFDAEASHFHVLSRFG